MTDTIGAIPPGLNTAALLFQTGDARYSCSWNTGEIALSPEGNWLAFGTSNSLCVLNAHTGLPHAWLNAGTSSWINKLAFTKNEQWLVWGGWNETIHVGQMDDPSKIKNIVVEKSSATCVVTSPADPNLVYTGGTHQHSRLTNAATGSIVAEIPFWDDEDEAHVYVLGAAFSPDGEHLALVTSNCLDVWNVRSLERIFREKTDPDQYTCVAFSNDGDDLFVGTRYGVVQSYNPRTGTKELERELFSNGQAVQQLLPIPNKPELLCTGNRAMSAIVSTTSLKPRVQNAMATNTSHLQVDPSGSFAFGKFANGLMHRVSLGSLQSDVVYHPRDVQSLSFSADDSILTVLRSEGVVEQLQISTQQLTQHRPRTAGHAILSTHGNRAIVFRYSTRGIAEQIDTTTGAILSTRNNEKATNRLVALCDNGDEWEMDNARLLHHSSTDRYVDSAAFRSPSHIEISPDETRVAVRAAATLTIINAVTAEIIATAKLAGNTAVALDANKGGVAVAGKKLAFFTDDTLQDPIATPVLGDMHSIAITPDGSLAAAGLNDGTVVLVPRADPKKSVRFKATIAQLQAVAFSNNGKLIAAGGSYPIVRVYSVDTLMAALAATPGEEEPPKTKKKPTAKKASPKSAKKKA